MNIELVKARLDVVFATMMLNSLLVDDKHAKEINGYARQIDLARKELSCESSANCSGTSGNSNTSTCESGATKDIGCGHSSPPSAPVAIPAKLSWCQIADFPHLPDGEYPLRYHGERFAGSVGIVRGGRWVNLDPTKDKELEYFPIHLV